MLGSRRLLVTGCGGFVGGAVAHEAGPGWETKALTRGPALLRRPNLEWRTLDILDERALAGVFEEAAPDAVIHCAAIADIDVCEREQDKAYDVNVGVTQTLARLCRTRGTRLVYVSTDTVFDGAKGGYLETDPPGPLNWYAETKVAAERIVSDMPQNWVVARTSLVMGLPLLTNGVSSIGRAMRILQNEGRLAVSPREIRSPIDVVTLARALLEIARAEFKGYIHLAGNDVLNRFEMTRRAAVKFGLPQDGVVPRDDNEVKVGAPRPLDVSLSNARARALLKTPMLGLEAGLELSLSTKKGVAS
jgi:dTDP-4-dehydrorhamnose reductase